MSISNKCCSFEQSSHQRENESQFPQSRLIVIIIRNVSWTANHHVRMISEGSCDTEGWSNDAD